MSDELKAVGLNSSLITHHSSLPLLFLLAAAGDDLLGLLDGFLEAVPVAVLEFGEGARGDDGAADHLQRELDAVGHLRAGGYLREVYAELHHRLRYRRRDSGEDAARAHQARGRHGLD